MKVKTTIQQYREPNTKLRVDFQHIPPFTRREEASVFFIEPLNYRDPRNWVENTRQIVISKNFMVGSIQFHKGVWTYFIDTFHGVLGAGFKTLRECKIAAMIKLGFNPHEIEQALLRKPKSA